MFAAVVKSSAVLGGAGFRLSWANVAAPSRRRLLPQMRLVSGSGGDTQTPAEYLWANGFTDADVVAGMLKVFPSPNVPELQKFGQKNLENLARAVAREVEKTQSSAHLPDVTVYLADPHSGISAKPVPVTAKEGQSLWDVHMGGDPALTSAMECACGGIAACSTCHVILDQDTFTSLPPPEEAELDMLDLTEGVTPTSRLGCQLSFSPALQGKTLTLPDSVHNLF